MKSNYKRSKIKFSDLYYKDADTSARKSAYKSKNTLNFSSLDLIDGYYYFRNEKFSGKAEIYYNNGVLKALLSFRNGIKNGLSTYWYSNGVKQKESFFENGVLDGFETTWNYDETEIGSIAYEKGIPLHGKHVRFLSDRRFDQIYGYILTGYKNGYKQGEYYEWQYSINGNLSGFYTIKGYFSNGKKSGTWYKYYKNGAKKQLIKYVDNKAEQKVFYREDGSKIGILTYKEGCPFNGIFIEIEERMGISITGQYKNGRKIKTWKAVQQDTLLWQKKYKAGFRTGKWYKYNQKTCTKTFVHFKNNKMNGWYTEYTTKKLSWAKKRYILRSFFRKLPWVAITKGKYKDDKKTGKWVYRDREGNIIRTEFWNYGVLKQ